MEAVRIGKCRRDSPAGLAKAKRQVVVFAAPADEVLIEAIHGFEVVARNSDVVAGELWFQWVADPAIELPLNSYFEKPILLSARGPVDEDAGSNCLLVDPVGRFFIQSDAVAGASNTRPAGLHVFEQMVGRK